MAKVRRITALTASALVYAEFCMITDVVYGIVE